MNTNKLTRSRTQRMLDLIKHPLLDCHQNVNANNEHDVRPSQIEQPACEIMDISNSQVLEEAEENSGSLSENRTYTLNDELSRCGVENVSDQAFRENNENNIPLKGDIDAINILSSNCTGSSPNVKLEDNKFKQKVPITQDFDDNSSSDSSSNSNSSDSDSSSTSTDSSKNSLPEPFGSDDSCKDPTYNAPPPDNRGNYSSEDEQDKSPRIEKRKVKDPCDTEKTGKKRKRNVDNWRKNVAKRLRNSGESYVSKSVRKNEDGTKAISKVTRPARSLLPPCGMKCKLKCSEKITLDQRTKIFDEYWKLKNIEKQREFISSNMQAVNPKYKYCNREKPRNPNNAYYFLIQQKRSCV